MKTSLVQIGNSRGIRIPKAFLEQCQFRDKVELELRGAHLIVRAASSPRSRWENAFRGMHKCQDDSLVDEDALLATEWDTAEWEW